MCTIRECSYPREDLASVVDSTRQGLHYLERMVRRAFRVKPPSKLKVCRMEMRTIYDLYLRLLNEFLLYRKAYRRSLEQKPVLKWFPSTFVFSPGRWKLVCRSEHGAFMEVEREPLFSPSVVVPMETDVAPLPPFEEYHEYEYDASVDTTSLTMTSLSSD